MQKIQAAANPAKFGPEFREFNDPEVQFRDYDYVVPVQLRDYGPLWRRHAGGPVNFLIPNPGVVAMCDDKIQWDGFLRFNGFDEFAPCMYNGTVSYPFIYKKRQDEWGAHSRIIHSLEEKEKLETIIVRDDYFKQEYVSGRIEYVTHVLAVKGKPYYMLTYEHGFDTEYFIKGKWANFSTHREVETPCTDVLCSILETLNYTGTCCFNYKYADGVPKIFEMNPRYGATLTLTINDYLDAYVNALAA
ncbi:MAG TPA: hypothetical protein VIJ62_15020 [Rhizomicrobium sp.]